MCAFCAIFWMSVAIVILVIVCAFALIRNIASATDASSLRDPATGDPISACEAKPSQPPSAL